MKMVLKLTAILVTLLIVAALGYAAFGYFDAVRDADNLQQRANSLISKGSGGDALGNVRYRQILMVQDPKFEQHSGVDMMTAGAGVTTITQSLAKRVGFEKFKPGIGKIRQTGYALGLERQLSKDQIMALWLDTVEMGKGPNGWMTGFHKASRTIYGQQPHEIEDKQFLSLVAVLIAPAKYNLGKEDVALQQRIDRISRLLSGECSPQDNSDVWLEACAK